MSTVGDVTQSDSGPWATYEGRASPDDTDVHVVPMFGPCHMLTRGCWCWPCLDDEGEGYYVMHNVAQ